MRNDVLSAKLNHRMHIERHAFGWPKNLPSRRGGGGQGAIYLSPFTYLQITHWTAVVTVRGDDDIDILDDTLKRLVEILLLKLQFEQSTIHFVHEQDRLDTLGNSLTEYGFSLHADTCDETSRAQRALGNGVTREKKAIVYLKRNRRRRGHHQ